MGFSVVNGQVFHNSSGAVSSSDKSLVLVNRVYGIGNVSSWFRGERELLDNNDIRRGELGKNTFVVNHTFLSRLYRASASPLFQWCSGTQRIPM